jgi:pimeloyl-ACP methyl ester carboxylesterase
MARAVLSAGGAVTRTAVAIPNRDGKRMYGVLTTPASGSDGTEALVLCHAGVTSKAGTGEYMRILADQLAALGRSVLRFDQSGVGDSEGEIGDGIPINRYYRMIQTGRSVADTEDAVDWLAGNCRPASIALLGHCGGCVTAALVAARRPGTLRGLIFIALPVLYSPLNGEPDDRTDADRLTHAQLRKLLRPEGYLNVFQGRTDLRLMTRAVATYGIERLRRWTHGDAVRTSSGLHPLFNRLLAEAFEELMKRRTPVLLVLPELDVETETFEVEFRAKLLDARAEYAGLCRVEVLPDTDHSVMFEASRERLKSVLCAGLEAMART